MSVSSKLLPAIPYKRGLHLPKMLGVILLTLVVASCKKDSNGKEDPRSVFPYITGKIEPHDKDLDEMKIGIFLKIPSPRHPGWLSFY